MLEKPPMLKRLAIFFIFVGLFSLVFHVGSTSSVNEVDAQKMLDELELLIDGIDAFGIFTHNTTIALPMLIPGFGVAWGMFAAWSTGYAFASIAALTPELDIAPLAILYLSPFGLMELTAYSLATSRSYILIADIIRKMPLRPHLMATAVEAGAVVALLLAGGYVEYYMIESIQDGSLEISPLA